MIVDADETVVKVKTTHQQVRQPGDDSKVTQADATKELWLKAAQS